MLQKNDYGVEFILMSFINNLLQKRKKPLRVYWWRYGHPNKLNFGDEITPLLIKDLFKQKVIWAEPDKCDLIGVGSIIQDVSDRAMGKSIHVWGSGFIEDCPPADFDNLKFHAVRGKLTLERIKHQKTSQIALGDPALLLPLVFKPERSKTYKVGIVPHYVDADSSLIDRFKTMEGVTIINVLKPVEEVVKQVNSCQIILSSSLHGLIVSDAYNIPNYWVPLSDKVHGGRYKFDDYSSVFDRKANPLSIDNIREDNIDLLIKSYKSVQKELPKIQEGLIEAFPYK